MATEPRTLYDTIAAELGATAAVSSSQMFGMPCLKHGGKAFAGFYRGAMTFKLRQPDHAAALALAGAHLFDPSGAGRPMKEWIVVPAEYADQWPAFAREALHYLAATL
jgi:hypothetical protein